MLEALLAFVLVAWVTERAYTQRQWARERKTLLNAALARTVSEQLALDHGDRQSASTDPDALLPDGFEHQAGL